jgi:hypothetical protein
MTEVREANPPKDGLIRSLPAHSPSPLGFCDLCRGFPSRSIRRGGRRTKFTRRGGNARMERSRNESGERSSRPLDDRTRQRDNARSAEEVSCHKSQVSDAQRR